MTGKLIAAAGLLVALAGCTVAAPERAAIPASKGMELYSGESWGHALRIYNLQQE